MIAILIKELRENLKWAALTSLLLWALFAWAVQRDLTTGMSLLGSTMEMASVIAFPAIGLALGMLAILPDSRRGRWQFVMHRPIAPGHIFFAKAIAGAALYLLAMLPPLLAVYAWSAAPGHVVGPVTPDMLLPRLADLFGGLVWYFAGMFIAARQARWVGSRLVPIGAALAVSTFATFFPIDFAGSLLITAIAALLFLLMARSVFVGGGELPRRAWLMRALTGLSLLIGWMLAVAVAVAAITSLLEMLSATTGTGSVANYQILDDGRIVVTYYNDASRSVTDRFGSPIDMDLQQISKRRLRSADLQLTSARPQDMSRDERQDSWGFHVASAHLRPVARFYEDNARWFFIVERNTLEGFDFRTRRSIGYLGPEGWTRTPRPFPEPLYRVGSSPYSSADPSVIVAGQTTVWKLDLKSREVRRLFTASGEETVLDSHAFPSIESPDGTENAIATTQAIYILAGDQTRLRVPLAHRMPAYDAVSVGTTRDGRLVLDFSPNIDNHPVAHDAIEFLSKDGTTVQQIDLPPLPQVTYVAPAWEKILQMLPPFTVPALTALLTAFPSQEAANWGMAIGIAALAMLATIPLARRRQYSTAGVAGWAVLNLLLGPPGVLLLLSMDDAVPTVTCSACGRGQPVSRGDCPHCAAVVAPPARIGIEIFARVDVLPASP